MKFQSSALFQVVNKASDTLQEVKEWETHELWVDVATSLNNPTPVRLNVIETMGHDVRLSAKKKANPMNRHYLPGEMSYNDDEYRRDVVVPHFSRAALVAGFGIRSRGWEPKKNCLKLTCERFKECKDTARSPGDVADSLTKGLSQRVPSTKKAVCREETCNFSFTVHWCPQHKRWFLPRQQQGNKRHNGHIHRNTNIAPARTSDSSAVSYTHLTLPTIYSV